MALCTKCGTQLADDAKFCVSCGTSVEETASEPKPETKNESASEKNTGGAKEKLNAVKEKANTGINKLPFKRMAEEKIPTGARAKFPILEKAIPFTNQIVCGLAVVLVVTVIAVSASGGGSGPKALAKQTYKLEQAAYKVGDNMAKAEKLSNEASIIALKVLKLSESAQAVYLEELGRLQTGIVASAPKKAKTSSPAKQSNSSASQASDVGKFTMAAETDFVVSLARDGTAIITKYVGSGGNIIVPATIQEIQVTEIGDDAFGYNSNLTGVQLPEGLKVIGKKAFYGESNFRESNNISTIIIPNTVTEIGGSAFDTCKNLESINIPDSVTVFGYGLFARSGLKSFTIPAGMIAMKEIPYDIYGIYDGIGGMFYGSNLETIVIPEGIETIGRETFSYCRKLTSVTLPSTIKTIDISAFQGCSNLTEVIIPESVMSIGFSRGAGSFAGCPKMNLASQARLRQLGYERDF